MACFLVPPVHQNLLLTSEQELPEAHRLFDDAEDRFHGLLAQTVQRATCWRLESMRHALDGVRLQRYLARFAQSVIPGLIVLIAPVRDQRCVPARNAPRWQR